jgi:glucuronosyltransferase
MNVYVCNFPFPFFLIFLAHPKIKAFLTQAGRPSCQEALEHSVPTITFPVLADQDFNADRMLNLGTSIGLDFVGLTQEKLTDALSKILNDER